MYENFLLMKVYFPLFIDMYNKSISKTFFTFVISCDVIYFILFSCLLISGADCECS